MATFFFFTLLSISFFLLLLLPRNVVVNSTRLENDSSSSQFDLATLSPTSLKLLGDAHWNNGSLRLSRDLGVPYSGSGRVLYSKPVKFRQPGTHFPVSFSTFFTFSVTNLNPSSIGGGLAFVISLDDQTVGLAGGYLGLVSEIGTTSPGFVSVEFDTLMDIEFKDINGNHVGLDLNSMVSSQVGDLGLVGVELKSGDLVSAWIDYDGVSRVFNVSVSYSNRRPVEPLLSFDLDLDRYVNDFMFVGFSGSTQGSTEVHSIEGWSFSSSFNSPSASPLPSTPFGYGLSLPPPTSAFFNPTANAAPPALDSLAPSGSVSSSPQKREKISSSSSCHNQLCKQGPGAVAGVVTAGAFFLAICAGLLIWGFTKKYKFIKKPESLNSGIFSIPKEFSYKELKTATRCFDPVRIIGHGAFGTVYKGIFPETGALIAVKRCHGGGQGRDEFLSELSIIGTLRHRNLVRLQGWCHEKGEILLVYDLMPNGSLDKSLYESRIPLPWHFRKKILMGVASALAYLHQECENQVIHRDIKSSNIMLDEGFNARLGDFGLAKQVEHDKSPDATVTAGTMGYLAPEYLFTGKATEKTDVFSYGAVVLEVVSGRRPIEKETSTIGGESMCSNLVEWVWSLHREGRSLEAVDTRLRGEFDEGEVRRVILIGLACSHPDPLIRPTMRSVVQMLVGETEIPIVTRSKPTLSFSTSQLLLNLQDSVSDCNEIITITTSSSENSFIGDGLV